MPGGPGNGFQDQRRDGGGAFEADQLLEVLQGALAFLLFGGGVERRAVEVGREEVDRAGAAGVAGPAAGVAGEVDRELGAAVVRTVGGEDLVAAGVEPGHPDGVFVGVGAAVGEEDPVQFPRSAFGDQPRGFRPGVVDIARGDGAQLRSLRGDGSNDGGVLVADVGVDQLGGEVEVLVAVAVPHMGALGRGDDHRIQEVLGGPGVEDVLAVQLVGAAGRPGVPGQRQDAAFNRGSHDCSFRRGAGQAFCGKPRLMPPWLGSSQREVTALPRVKKPTPSVPWAWVSPNSEFFQPPNE